MQTANFVFITLIQPMFYLTVTFSDAMRLVPVYFG